MHNECNFVSSWHKITIDSLPLKSINQFDNYVQVQEKSKSDCKSCIIFLSSNSF